MTNADSPIAELDRDRCLELLGSSSLGRLVTVTGGRAEIFPVNYVLDGSRIVFRTAEGTKLANVTVQPDVVFEVDHIEGTSAWSLVVRGTAHRIDAFSDIEAADRLDLKPWVPTLKYNYVEIPVEEVSGRGFEFADEPERYQA